MCIIAVVSKGVEVKEDTLKICFENNPDGAGIMYNENGRVFIDKGFMTFESFIKKWRTISVNVDRVAHFRISTSGNVDQGNTHPFPVCDDFNEMRITKNVCELAIAHNGVISHCTPKIGSIENDTMTYIKEYIYPVRDLIHRSSVRKLVELSICSSRFAVMNHKKIYMLGKWYEQDGVFFSNDGYKAPKVSYVAKGYNTYAYNAYNYGSYGIWDDEESTFLTKTKTTGGKNERPKSYNTKQEKLIDYDDYATVIIDLADLLPHEDPEVIVLEMFEHLEKVGFYVDDYDIFLDKAYKEAYLYVYSPTRMMLEELSDQRQINGIPIAVYC